MVKFNMLGCLDFGSLRPLYSPALFGELVLGTFLLAGNCFSSFHYTDHLHGHPPDVNEVLRRFVALISVVQCTCDEIKQ